MSKKLSLRIILPAILVSAVSARADSSYEQLDREVTQDLFTSQLSTPKNQEQSEFESGSFKDKEQKSVKVEQAPSPLTRAERTMLLPEARLLWNRVWYYDQGHRDANQRARIAATIDLYNKMIEDFNVDHQKSAQNQEVEGSSTNTSAQAHLQEQSTTCLSETNALATENIKTVVLATNAATKAAVQPEQNADIAKTQAEELDPMPVNPQLQHAPSIPVKVAVADGGFLVSMSPDPANPQTLYGLDLLPSNVNVTIGNSITQKQAYDIVQSSDGGKTWTTIHKFLTSPGNILDGHIVVSAGAKDIFVTTNDGVVQSRDRGNSFSPLPNALGKPVDAELSRDGTQFAVSYDNGQGIQTFNRQNGSWVKAPNQPADLVRWVNAQFQADPSCTPGISIGASSGRCPYDVGANLKVFSVQMDPTQPGVLYAGLGQGEYKYQNGKWSVLQGMGADTTVNNIEIGSDGKMLVSTCNGIYQGQTSQNQMTKITSPNFINQDTGLSDPGYLRSYEVSVNPQNPKEVVSVSASGVYISKDSGTTWTREKLGADPGHGSSYTINEFRSAVWSNGSVEVSSLSGAYQFTP